MFLRVEREIFSISYFSSILRIPSVLEHFAYSSLVAANKQTICTSFYLFRLLSVNTSPPQAELHSTYDMTL